MHQSAYKWKYQSHLAINENPQTNVNQFRLEQLHKPIAD